MEQVLPTIAIALFVQLILLYIVIKLAVNDALYKSMNEIIKLLKELKPK